MKTCIDVLSGLALVSFMVPLIAGCEPKVNQEVSTPPLGVQQNMLEKLGDRRIFFGHQSVGYNIIEGIADLMKESTGLKLSVVEIGSASDLRGAAFAHAPVGKNENPRSKIAAFNEMMRSGIGDWADIAFFKFCYIDIDESTDVKKIFDEYAQTMAGLKRDYPRTVFVHVTAPLTTVQKGLKARIKSLLGRPVGGYEANIRRNQYNQLVRAAFEGKEPLFDLAGVESNAQEGRRETYTKGGVTYEALAREYGQEADLGRHLNERGRKTAALGLVEVLANIEPVAR